MVQPQWIWQKSERFIKHVLNETIWEKQLEIVRSVEENKRTAVRTAHAIGKTRVAADITLSFLFRHKNSMVITTAPTWRQVYQQLWREIRGRHNNAKLELPGQKFLTPRYEISDEWHAIGLSTKEPEKFAGYHAPYLLIIVDEASGIEPRIYEAIYGIMAGGECRLLLLGNPTQRTGEFYEAFHSGRNIYNTIHVGAWDTPNLKPHREKFLALETQEEKIAFLYSIKPTHPYLITPEYVADMMQRYGEHTQIYKVRVDGEFVDSEPDQLIPLAWVMKAVSRWEDMIYPPPHLGKKERWWKRDKPETKNIYIGADIARFGDCETVIVKRQGEIVAPLMVYTKQDTMETAGRIIIEARKHNAKQVNIDVVGVGSGVYDQCATVSLPRIVPVNVGMSAYESDQFDNLRSEAFWNLRKKFERGKIAIPRDEKLIGQLTCLKYSATGGKIRVESKEKMKGRGLISPDRADALCLAMMDPLPDHIFTEDLVEKAVSEEIKAFDF